ncbi:MAG: ECF-type sigma factor [Bryobacteraceae bacterium]
MSATPHSPPGERDPDLTLLLEEWGKGRDEAFRRLLPLAYDRLRTIAGALMRSERPDHTLQPTALVCELYLRLARKGRTDWDDREHFYRFCARVMRSILTDHARKRPVEKRALSMAFAPVAEMPWLGRRPSDITDLDLALSKLEAFDERKAKVLELRAYLGVSANETAEILGLSKATVDRDLTTARAWLFRELRPREIRRP